MQIPTLWWTKWWYVSTVGDVVVISQGHCAENLAAGTGTYSPTDAVQDWVSEVGASYRTHNLKWHVH